MDDGLGNLGGLVESIYDLALDPADWPRLLQLLADSFGATAGSIMQENLENGAGAGLVMGLDPTVPPAYFDHYANTNVLRRVDNLRERMKTWVPIVTVDEHTMPKSQLMETEFYVDFLKPGGIHSVLTWGLWAQGTNFAAVDLYRSPKRPAYEQADVDKAEAIHGHVIRAMRLGRKVAETRTLGAGLAAALDRAPYGLFVLGADGRISHANAVAERMLAQPGGLRVFSGRLTPPHSDDARRLGALIAQAAGMNGARAGGSMALRRAGERAPLSVIVAPTRGEGVLPFHVGPSVIVCVTDPEAAASVSEAFLGELFGLTGGQAKIAASLLEGRSPRQTAEALGLSFYTVRAHLVRIFEKTGTSRQAELVALMTRALGASPA
jgi:DNA-binding CsgD family transcriptional regulator